MKKIINIIVVAVILIYIVPINVSAEDPNTTTPTVSANAIAPGTFIGGRVFSTSAQPVSIIQQDCIVPTPYGGTLAFKGGEVDYGMHPLGGWNGFTQGVLDAINEGRAELGKAPLYYNYEKQNLADIRINEICNYKWYPSPQKPGGDVHMRPNGTWCYTVGETSEVAGWGGYNIDFYFDQPIGYPQDYTWDDEDMYFVGQMVAWSYQKSKPHWDILMRDDITSLNVGYWFKVDGVDHAGDYNPETNNWDGNITDVSVILVY